MIAAWFFSLIFFFSNGLNAPILISMFSSDYFHPFDTSYLFIYPFFQRKTMLFLSHQLFLHHSLHISSLYFLFFSLSSPSFSLTLSFFYPIFLSSKGFYLLSQLSTHTYHHHRHPTFTHPPTPQIPIHKP